MRKRIFEVEETNEIATIALSRTQASIRRLRLEHAILLERLEDRAKHIPNGINNFEEMAQPPTPNVLDDTLVKSIKNGGSRRSMRKLILKTLASGGVGGSGTGSGSGLGALGNGHLIETKKPRDPDLPKRPSNAYLVFCEQEKERLKLDDPESKDLSRTMTEAWKSLSEEERRPYYKLYEDDRVRYQREMDEYNRKKEQKNQIKNQSQDQNANGEQASKRQKTEKLDNEKAETETEGEVDGSGKIEEEEEEEEAEAEEAEEEEAEAEEAEEEPEAEAEEAEEEEEEQAVDGEGEEDEEEGEGEIEAEANQPEEDIKLDAVEKEEKAEEEAEIDTPEDEVKLDVMEAEAESDQVADGIELKTVEKIAVDDKIEEDPVDDAQDKES